MNKKRTVIIILVALLLIVAISLLTVGIIFKNNKNNGEATTYTITVKYNNDTHVVEIFHLTDMNELKRNLDSSILIKDKDGSVFVGWEVDGKEVNFEEPITEDMTIEAKWVEENKEENITTSTDISHLYKTNLNEQLEPVNLIVLVFNYKDSYYDISDEEVEAGWADYIFGYGDSGNPTINGYFKEMSNGKFYFKPVLLGDNKTGVYSFHFDEEYNADTKPGPFDVARALDKLVKMGLDLEPYKIINKDNLDYTELYNNQYEGGYDVQPAQWFTTPKILVVYPPYDSAQIYIERITESYPPEVGLIARVNYDSSFGTVAHELVHTLGAIDTYRYGSFGSDLMSDQFSLIADAGDEYNTMHINPYYKMLFGWTKPTIVEGQGEITLYPQNSEKYNPIIVKTDSDDEYYIIENRVGFGYDKVNMTNAEGINVWRITHDVYLIVI